MLLSSELYPESAGELQGFSPGNLPRTWGLQGFTTSFTMLWTLMRRGVKYGESWHQGERLIACGISAEEPARWGKALQREDREEGDAWAPLTRVSPSDLVAGWVWCGHVRCGKKQGWVLFCGSASTSTIPIILFSPLNMSNPGLIFICVFFFPSND